VADSEPDRGSTNEAESDRFIASRARSDSSEFDKSDQAEFSLVWPDSATFQPTETIHRGDPPGSSGSSLVLIVGIVLGGVILVAILAAALIFVRRNRSTQPLEEPEVDPVAQFYDDNKKEVQAEYEMAFENPVFDLEGVGDGVSSDEFGGLDEAIVT
jgi:hypothetical protein